MQLVPRNRSQAWGLVVLVAIATALLGWQQTQLGIDAENRALRVPNSADGLALQQREREFGTDSVMLISFAALGTGPTPLSPAEHGAMQELQGALSQSRYVRKCTPLPTMAVGFHDLIVELVPDPKLGGEPAVREVERIARSHAQGMRLAMTGIPAVESDIARAVQAERVRIVPRMLLVLVLLLCMCFRGWKVAVAVLTPALVGITWTSGLFAWLGHLLDPVAVLLDPVLLTVGVAGGVQIAESYLRHRNATEQAWIAAQRAAVDIARPAMLAALTTVVGFLSLATQNMPAVIDFGVFAALGVSVTFLLGLVLTPTLLALFQASAPATRRLDDPQIISQRTSTWLKTRAGRILVAVSLVTALSAFQWPKLRIDNDPLAVLPPAHQRRQDTRELAQRLGGVELFELYVPQGHRQAQESRWKLLQAQALAMPGVAGSAGPARQSTVGSLVIPALLAPGGAGMREPLFQALDERMHALGADPVRSVGTSVQMTRDSTRLIRGQLRGLGITVLALWAIFVVALRSVKLGTLAIVPNLVPGAVLYGALALGNRPVTVATAMISSVMLGLIVDSTIHFLHHYQTSRKLGQGARAAVQTGMAHTARGILFTALVLAAGFAVGATGALETTIEFSLLSSATVVMAVASVLVILPALLLVLDDQSEFKGMQHAV